MSSSTNDSNEYEEELRARQAVESLLALSEKGSVKGARKGQGVQRAQQELPLGERMMNQQQPVKVAKSFRTLRGLPEASFGLSIAVEDEQEEAHNNNNKSTDEK